MTKVKRDWEREAPPKKKKLHDIRTEEADQELAYWTHAADAKRLWEEVHGGTGEQVIED